MFTGTVKELVDLVHKISGQIKISHGGWWESYASSHEVELVRLSDQLKKEQDKFEDKKKLSLEEGRLEFYKRLTCPILNTNCLTEKCAWWDGFDYQCAILSLEVTMDSINTHLHRKEA